MSAIWVSVLPDLAGEDDWRDSALCAQTGPEAFFPEKGESPRLAKRVCAACPVRAECLEYALEANERFGVWGMKTPRERLRILRQRGLRDAA